jgi:hypothetical protein
VNFLASFCATKWLGMAQAFLMTCGGDRSSVQNMWKTDTVVAILFALENVSFLRSSFYPSILKTHFDGHHLRLNAIMRDLLLNLVDAVAEPGRTSYKFSFFAELLTFTVIN